MMLQVGVKALIKNSRNEYLFLGRTKKLITDTDEVSWDIPGGRIEAGEDLISALRREIKEEIGHDATSTPRLIAAQDIFVDQKDLHVVRLTYILDEDVDVIRLSDEHDDFVWINVTDLSSINAEPYLRKVLQGLVDVQA